MLLFTSLFAAGEVTAPLEISGAPASFGWVDAPYTGFTPTVTGGKSPYTFSLVSFGSPGGSLPPGLTLNASTGEISGTPTSDGEFDDIVMRVTDDDGATADLAAFDMEIDMAFSGALIKKSADQTAADYTAETALTFDAEDFDTDAYHDTGSNTDRITIPASGVQRVVAFGNIIANQVTSDLLAQAFIRHYNSSGVLQRTYSQAAQVQATTVRVNLSTGPLAVSPGDILRLSFQVATDTSITILSGGTFFSVMAVG